MIEVSAVICFRDWGLDRLALALRSHAESELGNEVEVIVSDYGSVDGGSVREVVERHGAVYVRTDVDGPWSRSRALNAGIAHARGRVIVTTDADMLFTPQSHRLILDHLAADPNSVQLLQCRDLSAEFSAETIDTFDWARYERNSTLRPRWGMGGMIAFDIDAYESIRGYEERMEIYGGEDNDFAQRLRRAGYRLNWIDDPRCRIFHVWHESSRESADSTPEGRAAIERNRDIAMNDRTWVRNLHWKYPRVSGRPLVTVSIATFNRADYLDECICSVLSQDFQELEIVIVDDGSTDHTEDVVRAYGDSRLRYFRQPNSGVSVARNRALAEARAPFMVIQDDDDLMLPWRISAHFDALAEGVHGTYGGWIDFQDATGELGARPGKEFGLAQMLYSGRVMAHGTLMMRTDVLRHFGYNSSLRAGTDFNLALRMTMSGIRLRHTGQFHILRRFHGGNLTDTISDHQKDSARKTTALFRRNFTTAEEDALRKQARAVGFVSCRGEDDLPRLVGPYLPDKLTKRDAVLRLQVADAQAAIERFASEQGLAIDQFCAVDSEGRLHDRVTYLRDVSMKQILELRRLGFLPEVENATADGDAEVSGPPTTKQVVSRIADVVADRGKFYCALMSPSHGEASELLWNMETGTRRLAVIGRSQYVIAVEAFAEIGDALCFQEQKLAAVPGISALVIQKAG